MKRFFKLALASAVMSIFLAGCGQDPELTKFKNDIDNFCNSLNELDSSMNKIDASSDTASAQLLEYLDEVDMRFKNFAQLDFPEDYDYLEPLADEASEYMTEAVTSFHSAYSNGSYNEYTADYAQQNYARAMKRIKIIITFLHGETPEDDDVTITYTDNQSAEE